MASSTSPKRPSWADSSPELATSETMQPDPERSHSAAYKKGVGAAHALRTVRHLARKTSVGFMMPLVQGSGLAESFMVPTGAEAEALWEHTLIQYGHLPEGDARHVATIFSGANIPAPSNDCVAFLTHEFLISLGISDPGDRARVLLAIQRMPAPQLQLGGLQLDEHQVRLQQASVQTGGSASYTEDTDTVNMHVLKNRDNTVTWIDLVGKDARYGEAAYDASEFVKKLTKIQRAFEYTTGPDTAGIVSMTSTLDITVAEPPGTVSEQSPSPQESYKATSPMLSAATPTNGPGDSPLRSSMAALGGSQQMQHPLRLNPAHASEDSNIWGAMKLETPLPHMVHDPDVPGRAAFILRVCTTGASVSDASFGALTNRWVVVADSTRNLVAIIHRVDSVALATLRDKDFKAMSDTITFKRVLASIFVSFLMEFEVALDRSNELLDDCEASLLDVNRHNELLEKLFHLERKASVYQRMIDLNQSLIMELGHYFSLSREIAFLEGKWIRLHQKASGLEDRSTNLLQLLLALSGHRTNELMAVLTRFSLVFTPMTFIAGVYGMNFRNMPELEYENGYYICIAVLVFLFIGGIFWSSRL